MKILKEILEAKEDRTCLRKDFSDQKKSSLSLSLNIPGAVKTNEIISEFFDIILSELKNYLLSHRIFLDTESEINIIDSAGNFFLSGLLLKNEQEYSEFFFQNLKEITEKYEEKEIVGRFIDIDIYDTTGTPVGSGKRKECFFCKQKPAVVCMREKNHSYEELIEFQNLKIKEYIEQVNKENIIRNINTICLKSILYEVSLSPKPGLTDYFSSGSHSDMHYFTFIDSSSIISYFFMQTAKAGYEFSGDLKNALPCIRNIGLSSEKYMFQATNGVNTQKGLIFLLGISAFVCGFLESKKQKFGIEDFSEYVKKICENIIENELQSSEKSDNTHGKTCFAQFGITGAGARYEAQNGFPTAINFGLKSLIENPSENTQEQINSKLKRCLVSLISENNDSNILYRKGENILEQLKEKAKETLLSKDFENKYSDLCNFCSQNNISPGGSADLLAVSIFLYNYFYKK